MLAIDYRPAIIPSYIQILFFFVDDVVQRFLGGGLKDKNTNNDDVDVGGLSRAYWIRKLLRANLTHA
jgi:hypothetical protein